MAVRVAIVYTHADELEGDGDELTAFAAAGIEVGAVVREQLGAGRAGLIEVLGRLAAGEATVIATPRLAAVAGSLAELAALLGWLAAARADLVALDVGLDTGSAAGRRAAAVLLALERWEREPRSGRKRRGRPGLSAAAPELGERITAMRAAGLSLQRIADALNSDGVPTQRGGSHWRPSSVQAALGYRRPRPPAPGAPPPPHLPPPHPPPPRGPAPHRPSRGSARGQQPREQQPRGEDPREHPPAPGPPPRPHGGGPRP